MIRRLSPGLIALVTVSKLLSACQCVSCMNALFGEERAVGGITVGYLMDKNASYRADHRTARDILSGGNIDEIRSARNVIDCEIQFGSLTGIPESMRVALLSDRLPQALNDPGKIINNEPINAYGKEYKLYASPEAMILAGKASQTVVAAMVHMSCEVSSDTKPVFYGDGKGEVKMRFLGDGTFSVVESLRWTHGK